MDPQSTNTSTSQRRFATRTLWVGWLGRLLRSQGNLGVLVFAARVQTVSRLAASSSRFGCSGCFGGFWVFWEIRLSAKRVYDAWTLEWSFGVSDIFRLFTPQQGSDSPPPKRGSGLVGYPYLLVKEPGFLGQICRIRPRASTKSRRIRLYRIDLDRPTVPVC